MKNYHEILGVPHNASREQIKKAYREQAVKYHPDKNGNKEVKEFLEITEAKQVLLDLNEQLRYQHQFAHLKNDPPPKATVLRRLTILFKKNGDYSRMKIAAATFGVLLIAASTFIGSTSKNTAGITVYEEPNAQLPTGNPEQAVYTQIQTTTEQALARSQRTDREPVVPAPAKKPVQIPVVRADRSLPVENTTFAKATSSTKPGVEENTAHTRLKGNFAPLLQAGSAPTEMNFNQQEMEQILAQLKKTVPVDENNSHCLQICKSRNCNVANAFELAEYLRMHGFSIGGRKVVNTNSQGVDIHESNGCIVLTVGQFKS